jgi:hypothetical protein
MVMPSSLLSDEREREVVPADPSAPLAPLMSLSRPLADGICGVDGADDDEPDTDAGFDMGVEIDEADDDDVAAAMVRAADGPGLSDLLPEVK